MLPQVLLTNRTGFIEETSVADARSWQWCWRLPRSLHSAFGELGEKEQRFPSSLHLPAPVATEERTLTYWITVQKFRNNKPYQDPFPLAGEINFEAELPDSRARSQPAAGLPVRP